MIAFKALVLLLTLASAALIVSCEEESKPWLEDDKPSGFLDSAKGKLDESIQLAKEGFARAEEALGNAKDKILASDFTQGVKDKFNAGVEKVKDAFGKAKESVSSNVSPFIDKVRTSMLDGVRNLREKLHKKDKTGQGGSEKEEEESGEKGAAKDEINSGKDAGA